MDGVAGGMGGADCGVGSRMGLWAWNLRTILDARLREAVAAAAMGLVDRCME